MRNGFTLVELLAVLVLIALVTVIVFPTVNDSIKKSRQSAYDAQVELITESAVRWGIDNVTTLPDIGSTEVIAVDIDTLIDGGYIKLNDEKLINPMTGKEMTGCVIVSYGSEYNQYLYNYLENCTD